MRKGDTMSPGTNSRKESNTEITVIPKGDPTRSGFRTMSITTAYIRVMTVLDKRNLTISLFPLLFITAALPIPQMAVSTVKKMTGPAVA